MGRDSLNFFLPFSRLEPNHENQLTRALLVTLRLSPIAHAAWLHLVAPGRAIHQLPRAGFDTQRRALRQASEADEPADLISVFLTPEEPLKTDRVLTESDRGQVLDAVINYGGELLVVVENKIAEADDRQARELNVTGSKVRLADGQEAVIVLWRDLLEAFFALRERDLVSAAEEAVLDDFVTYVEDYFPGLGPFRTLRLARGNRFRQDRRLRQVLGEAVGTEASLVDYRPYVSTPAGSLIGANAYLLVVEDEDNPAIELALYPADTLTQARTFYQNQRAVAALRDLRARPGWRAEPNFHFGYMQRGLCWTKTDRDLDEYIELWSKRIASERAVLRAEWDQYWTWLEHERIARPEDRAKFDRHFTESQRPSASPRPGLWLYRRWSLAGAEDLDTHGALRGQVREALDAVLTAFGEPPVAAWKRS